MSKPDSLIFDKTFYKVLSYHISDWSDEKRIIYVSSAKGGFFLGNYLIKDIDTITGEMILTFQESSYTDYKVIDCEDLYSDSEHFRTLVYDLFKKAAEERLKAELDDFGKIVEQPVIIKKDNEEEEWGTW